MTGYTYYSTGYTLSTYNYNTHIPNTFAVQNTCTYVYELCVYCDQSCTGIKCYCYFIIANYLLFYTK